MIIARDKELERLKECMLSDKSEFVAVYGRRRVGKTFLIREAFDYTFTFQYTGIANVDKQSQLSSFADSLRDYGLSVESDPTTWMEAFRLLKTLIKQSTETKKVIFLDELSWMWSSYTDLIPALESFWNGWASARKDIILIVCASATSWMMKNVIHARGGLHNRLSVTISLQPFSLNACEAYSEACNLGLTRNQILEAYMILGGIPYYWSLMSPHYSLAQNIDAMFFGPDAPLQDEYRYLYASLFVNPEPYMRVIEILATKKVGMTREEILGHLEQATGGTISGILEDLEHCGFIRCYKPFGKKKKGSIFQLIDCFTLFHFKFIDKAPTDFRFWSHVYSTPMANTWRGYAFERVCLWHIPQILTGLGISGILANACSWQCKADKDKGILGAQIDLVIDRGDKQVDLCEMKFCDDDYEIKKDEAENFERKKKSFKKLTATRKGIRLVLVTPFGLTRNKYAGMVNAVVTADHLFSIV